MKKQTQVLFTLLGLLAFAGCQKDNMVAPNATVSLETTIGYYAAGEYGQAVLTDDASWDLFLDRMFALAKEGYEVTIIPVSGQNGYATKDVVTYTTDDENDAKQWAKEMAMQGYSVKLEYNPDNGIWTCTAIK